MTKNENFVKLVKHYLVYHYFSNYLVTLLYIKIIIKSVELLKYKTL